MDKLITVRPKTIRLYGGASHYGDLPFSPDARPPPTLAPGETMEFESRAQLRVRIESVRRLTNGIVRRVTKLLRPDRIFDVGEGIRLAFRNESNTSCWLKPALVVSMVDDGAGVSVLGMSAVGAERQPTGHTVEFTARCSNPFRCSRIEILADSVGT